MPSPLFMRRPVQLAWADTSPTHRNKRHNNRRASVSIPLCSYCTHRRIGWHRFFLGEAAVWAGHNRLGYASSALPVCNEVPERSRSEAAESDIEQRLIEPHIKYREN